LSDVEHEFQGTNWPVFYLPPKANIPKQWVTQQDLFQKCIIFPSRGTGDKPFYNVRLDLETRQLSCDCLGFKKKGVCHHVKMLIIATCHPSKLKDISTFDTSIDSYFAFSEKEIGDRQLLVLNCLKENGPMSNRMIAERLHRPVNTVTGRCFELRSMGMVAECGRAFDFTTKRYVIIWMAVWWENNGN
jgi:hypothetical protein